MYCPECGVENEATRPLCYRCGTSLHNLEPVQPRVAALRGQSRLLTALGLLLIGGVGVLAVILALLFALTPDPQPLPTVTPSPMAAVAAISTATPRPVPTPKPALPARLTGRVIDHSTALPVAGAVVVAGRGRATSDGEGRYTIEGLASGQLVVAVACTDYAGGRSAIISVGQGETRQVDITLYRVGQLEEPADPVVSHPIDPGGAPTEEDAERLARLQGLAEEVIGIEPVTLRGIYWVNYRSGAGIRATTVSLDHEGWALAEKEGETWRVVKDSGALAVAVPAGWVAPKLPVPSEAELERSSSGDASPAQVQAEPAQSAVAELAQMARIAYVYEGDVWLIDPGGGDPVRLTTGEGRYHDPAWSPDGTKLVVVRSTSDVPDRPNLYIIDIATGEAKALTGYGQDYYAPFLGGPAWSPDGATILYGQSLDGLGRTWRIVSVGSDGSGFEQRIPVQEGYTVHSPAWAPDGQRITYSIIKEDPIVERPVDNWGIWVQGVDGQGARQLVAGALGTSSWSSDGSRIVYYRSDSPGPDIYVMGPDGSGVRRLTQDTKSLTPDWSPDDSQIVYVRTPESGHFEIWIMNADGSDPHKLTDGMDPAWQPASAQSLAQGTLLGVYARAPAGGQEVYQGPGTGHPKLGEIQEGLLVEVVACTSEHDWLRVHLPSGDEGWVAAGEVEVMGDLTTVPVVGPTGGRIAFWSDRDSPGHGEIYVMNADGSEQTRLTSDLRVPSTLSGGPPGVIDFIWSPARARFLYSWGGRVYSVGGDGSGRALVAEPVYSSHFIANFDLSPDGQRLVCSFFDRSSGGYELATVDFDGRNRTPLPGDTIRNTAGLPANANLGAVAWSPDGTKIAFTCGYGDDGLCLMNPDGTSAARITPSLNVLSGTGLDWSPDGRAITFSTLGRIEIDLGVAQVADGSAVKLVEGGLNEDADWSPDGSRIVFARGPQEGNLHIWVVNTNGTGLTQLTFEGQNCCPVWLP